MAVTFSPLIVNVVVSILIAQLGDANYIKREKAFKALKEFVPIAHGQLEANLSNQDPEIAHRCWILYRPAWEAKMEQIAFTMVKRFPWLYLDEWHTEEVQAYMQWAVDKWGAVNCHPDYQPYRDATKLWVLSQLRTRTMTLMEIRSRLEMMATIEQRWIDAYVRDR